MPRNDGEYLILSLESTSTSGVLMFLFFVVNDGELQGFDKPHFTWKYRERSRKNEMKEMVELRLTVVV